MEIKLRAKQRAGQMLKEGQETKQIAGRGGDRKSDQTDKPVSLISVGITHRESSDWQKLAKVPKLG